MSHETLTRAEKIVDCAKSNVGLRLRLAAAGTSNIMAKGELILLAKKAETRPTSRLTAEAAVHKAIDETLRKIV